MHKTYGGYTEAQSDRAIRRDKLEHYKLQPLTREKKARTHKLTDRKYVKPAKVFLRGERSFLQTRSKNSVFGVQIYHTPR